MIRPRPVVLFVCKLLFLYISVFITFKVQGQLNSDITRYSTQNGLSHDGVLCITRDQDGFMWFGTFDGINRFDGHNFVIYKSRPGDSSNLSSNKIRSIVEDKDAFLWIKTYDNKIYRFDKKTEKFLAISEGPYKNLFQDLIIEEIVPDAKDGVWLLTEGQGLFHAMNDSSGIPSILHYAKNKPAPFKINGNVVRFLSKEGNRIWIGTEAGLNCLQRSKNNRYVVVKFKKEVTEVMSSSSFTCAAQNKQFLFFCTENGKLLSYNLTTKEFKLNVLHPGTRLNGICTSTSGLLYISTTGKGLITLNPLTGKLSYSGLEANDTYFSLYEDKAGQVWIEPQKNGILKYNPQTGSYKHFAQKKDIISTSRDYQVVTDANGTLWVSMKGGGFGFYNPSSDEIDYFYDQPGTVDQKFSNIVTSLLADKTGVLWLSAKDGGINKVVSITDKFNHRRLISKPQIRSENHVRAMLRDSKNRLWICTKDGKIYIYKDGRAVSLFAAAGNGF